MQSKYGQAYLKSLPKFDRSVSMVCWVYNERILIEGFLRRIDELLNNTVEDYEIVIVNDGSTDGTGELIEAIARENPRIRVITSPQNENVGLASRKAIQAATKEYLFWQTIDWSYDITNLRIFLELLKKYDVVAGVRFVPVQMRGILARPVLTLLRLVSIQHITRRSDTAQKAFVSVINYLLIRLLFGVPLSDFQNVVFYRTKLIQSFDYVAKSSFVNPEGLLKAHWKGASIAEVPISCIPRQAGQAKGTRPRAIVASLKDITRCWLNWVLLSRIDRSKKGEIQRLNAAEWGLL